MKKLVITHLFLNLYLLSLLGPFLPVFDYLINYDYISTELCENKDKPILTCNGKCYLEKQVKKTNDLLDHQPHKTLPPKLDMSIFPVFIIHNPVYLFTEYMKENQNVFIFFEQLIPTDHISDLFTPPKF